MSTVADRVGLDYDATQTAPAGGSTLAGRVRPGLKRRSRRDLPSIGRMQRPYRVVVAKPGLDGHDRGAKVIARSLREAGFEVIYTGLHQTPEQIVGAVVQEDADAVGISLLSGAHMTLFPRVIALLGEADASDVLVFGGGIIPERDIVKLKAQGVAAIFTPGAPLPEIARWLADTLDARETASAG
jgi:methylmalonyl-CoA mutase, C-terminal domain